MCPCLWCFGGQSKDDINIKKNFAFLSLKKSIWVCLQKDYKRCQNVTRTVVKRSVVPQVKGLTHFDMATIGDCPLNN